MLSKALNDKFLNTYFKEEENIYVTELYDKWRMEEPKLLKVSYNKDEALKNHQEIENKILAKMRKRPNS